MKLSELPEISPQLAKFVPKDKFVARWNISYTFEPKYDGFCAILQWTREEGVAFISREKIQHPNIYPAFKKAIHEFFLTTPFNALIVHGELIAWDKEHPTGYLDALQLRLKKKCILRFIAFDFLLYQTEDNKIHDLQEYAWYVRRKHLQNLLPIKTRPKQIKLVPSKATMEELPQNL